MQQIQRYFRKAGKALARFFGRVKKGSPIDIAILVCAAALVIALLAKGIEALLPFDVIGASVIAMFIGMLINGYRKPGKTTAPGVKFTAKKILKFAIILLGASLNVTTILNVGRMSLTVMFFTLLTCFGGGYFIGRALGLDWKL